MKILYLTSDLQVGGISSSVVTSLKGLKLAGFDVCCGSAGGELVPTLEKEGIRHFYLPFKTKNEFHPKLFIAFLNLLYIIRKYDITHIHAHTRVTQVVSSFLAKLNRVNYISTCHSFFKPRWGRKIHPAWGSHVIALSDSIRTYLVNDFKVPKQAVTIIPNGIDCEKFKSRLTEADREALKDYYRFPDANFVIGSTSRMEKSKGYQYLLLAMVDILAVYPKSVLLLVGEGKYKSKLMRLANKLGIHKNVVFMGKVDDIAFPLEILDLFVLPSVRAEGFGLAALEAMAFGKAIVATNLGSVYTLVKEGENGLLINPTDDKALSAAILYLMKNPELLEKMKHKSEQIAHEEYSLDIVLEKTKAFYRSLEPEVPRS